MSCDFITSGRALSCKEYIGGLYKVWFANFESIDFTIDGTTNNLTDFATTGEIIYEYELKGTSSLNQEMTSSTENGSTYVTQTLTLDLQGGDYQTNNEIRLLAINRPYVFVQDNYGSVWLCGRLRGMDLTSGVHNTGGAISEKYGYTLQFVGTENAYANFVDGSTITAPWGGMLTNEPSIVTG